MPMVSCIFVINVQMSVHVSTACFTDNVHMQNSAHLISALVDAGVDFKLAVCVVSFIFIF